VIEHVVYMETSVILMFWLLIILESE